MANWLALLLQIGGFGAVLLLALFVMGKWLLKRITAALDSYTTAYFQQKAAIDARIERLEQLAEEQARLTRTVEGIKDEIAAQAKSRDNRWEFRREVYTNLIRLAVEFLRIYATLLTYTPKLSSDNQASASEAKERISAASVDLITKATEFSCYANLAPIATAEEVIAPILEAQAIFYQVADESSPEYEKTMQDKMQRLQVLLTKLHAAGRKDLWGTPQAEAKAQTGT